MNLVALSLAALLLMLLCIYCLRLRADVREAKRMAEKWRVACIQNEIAANAAIEMMRRWKEEPAGRVEACAAELNGALREKYRGNVIQFRRPV